MGETRAKVELRNPRRPELGVVEIDALADTGATHLCIPSEIRDRLELDAAEDKPVRLADGTHRMVAYVGPIELRYGGRTGFTGALVMGDEPLLGQLPLEDMDLVVVPKTRDVIPNPASPGAGRSYA
ncbi:MAG: clan AA aspartic protease [Gammaproteobacteria bacterium]|nr:clan AA aspartic protease [Gammaproteobacteria bacterium]